MQRLLLLFLLALALPAQATLNVLATVPEWAALVQEIGGDKVKVHAATSGLQDPHRIEAKPSLIARARNAQLLVATGADLERGWLPLVQRESANPLIQSGQPGYFEAAGHATLRNVPAVLDRSHGDVHAAGNPHIHLDPHNVLKVGEALAERLAQVDPAEAQAYRAGYRSFAERWQTAMARWETRAAPLKGVPVLVQHDAFSHLNAWLGLKQVGVLEPKPGVEPSSSTLAETLARQKANPARMVLRPAYQYDAPSRWIADKAGINAVTLPFTVGGSPEAKNLFSLFDDTVNRLLAGLK